MAKIRRKAGAGNDEVELNDEALDNVEGEEENEEGSEEEENVEDGTVEGDGEASDEEVEEEIKEEEAEEAKAPEAPKPALEKVRLKSDLNCHIGGKFHQFVAGKIYSVDANVKNILREAGYLEAL